MPPYVITVDETRNALWSTSRGFWDIATARKYVADLATAAKRIGRNGAPCWWLIDLSDGTIQSRETAELLGVSLPRLHPPKLVAAVVTTGTLHAMQAKRVVANDTHRYFTTVDAAEAWLDAQGRPA